MSSEALKKVVMLAAKIEAKPALYPDRSPHPEARKLTLADGSLAPDVVRAWAGFDERYPQAGSPHRTAQVIASKEGVVTSKPIGDVLADADAKELSGELASGQGIVLDAPDGQPKKVLWFRAENDVMVLSNDAGKLDKRQPFDEWLVSLFEA